MKIIVLSSYSYVTKVNNYGSMLQYFALQTYLERKGHEVKWLKYDAVKTPPTGINRWLREKILHSYFKTDDVEFHNKKGFMEFMEKYIHLTAEHFVNRKELYARPPKADLFVVGSDQVWNGYSPDRFLTFVPKDTPKISYAVSFGKSHVPSYLRPLLWWYLRGYKAISVRETEGVSLCQSLVNKKVNYVIDPSFLLRKDDYASIIQFDPSIKKLDTPYIYGYFVNPFPKNELYEKQSIDTFLNEKDMPFYVTGIQNAEPALADYKEIQPSPLEWINLILNADAVITNSFHGVAFAINLQRPFMLIVQNGDMSNQNCRYLNLLKKLGLEDRIYNSNKGSLKEQMEHKIDWKSVNTKREDFITESEEFLANALR